MADTEQGSPTLRRAGVVAGIGAVLGLLGGGGALLVRRFPPPPWHGRGKPKQQPSVDALREGFEVKDLSAKGLGYVLLGLALSATVLVAIVFGLIALFTHLDREEATSLTAEQRALLAPPAPRVQQDPIADLSRERAREIRAISGYGWDDVGHTNARVPLDRAKALLVGRSLDEGP